MDLKDDSSEQVHELQRWSCYVDEMDDTHVHLVMADETVDRGEEREIGSFPIHMLEHLSPTEGRYVTVRIMSDESMHIENTVISDEEREAGRLKVEALLGLLVQMRRDDEDPVGQRQEGDQS